MQFAGEGLQFTGSTASDKEPMTAEEELAHRVISRLRQHQPKAAMTAAVDLVNLIATTHDVGGGAWLQ